METPEEFEIRESNYIREKKELLDEMIRLAAEQDEVLAKIAALRKPVFGSPDVNRLPSEEYERIRKILYEGAEGECDYYLEKSEALVKRGYINGDIRPKPEIRLTEPICHGWLHDGMEVRREEQSYLLAKLVNPRHKAKWERKKLRKGNVRGRIRQYMTQKIVGKGQNWEWAQSMNMRKPGMSN